jgi:antibiotic biosynthesis monooxygenase (ABM) superfamily enzyme
MTNKADLDDGSVTVVTSRRVRPGHEEAFEEWLEGIGAAAARHPGFVWRRITRPKDHDRPEWVVVFKFESYNALRGWTESLERRQWLERVKPHVLDEFKETVLTGLERWFTLPALPGALPPPRYKMALVTLLVVYPLSQALGTAANQWLSGIPALLRSFVASLTLIVLLTWVVMPRVTRLLSRWLYPPR